MEHREWWIDKDGYLRTPGGTKIARRDRDRLLFFDMGRLEEVPMTAADWETIFALPLEAPSLLTIACHCGETLSLAPGQVQACEVCGRAWQMSPLQPWAGTDVQVVPCRS